MWNMENIFEKSFSVSMMDQPIEKIEIAKNKPSLAVVQTRKYLGLWNIRLIWRNFDEIFHSRIYL